MPKWPSWMGPLRLLLLMYICLDTFIDISLNVVVNLTL